MKDDQNNDEVVENNNNHDGNVHRRKYMKGIGASSVSMAALGGMSATAGAHGDGSTSQSVTYTLQGQPFNGTDPCVYEQTAGEDEKLVVPNSVKINRNIPRDRCSPVDVYFKTEYSEVEGTLSPKIALGFMDSEDAILTIDVGDIPWGPRTAGPQGWIRIQDVDSLLAEWEAFIQVLPQIINELQGASLQGISMDDLDISQFVLAFYTSEFTVRRSSADDNCDTS